LLAVLLPHIFLDSGVYFPYFLELQPPFKFYNHPIDPWKLRLLKSKFMVTKDMPFLNLMIWCSSK